MADIDDVMDKLEDVLNKLEDNKEKIDEVLAKDQINMVCGSCKDHPGEKWNYTGISESLGEPIITPCPECAGAAFVLFGNTVTSE